MSELPFLRRSLAELLPEAIAKGDTWEAVRLFGDVIDALEKMEHGPHTAIRVVANVRLHGAYLDQRPSWRELGNEVSTMMDRAFADDPDEALNRLCDLANGAPSEHTRLWLENLYDERCAWDDVLADAAMDVPADEHAVPDEPSQDREPGDLDVD